VNYENFLLQTGLGCDTIPKEQPSPTHPTKITTTKLNKTTNKPHPPNSNSQTQVKPQKINPKKNLTKKTPPKTIKPNLWTKKQKKHPANPQTTHKLGSCLPIFLEVFFPPDTVLSPYHRAVPSH